MIKLRALWNVPAGQDPGRVEELFRSVHTHVSRTLPGLRAHLSLRFLTDYFGSHPWWDRGEELWFTDEAALRSVVESPAWEPWASSPLWELVTGPRIDVFDIEDVYDTTGIEGPTIPHPGQEVTCLTGVWQVPPTSTWQAADEVYFRAHVPGVRALPRLKRHTVLKALPWPAGNHPRFWRSAEIRFASRADFDATFTGEEYAGIRTDGFADAVAGPDVDIFVIEEEWVPDAP
ncbi:EthD family reductase [Acrocarpospora catenulata]|uniref:EthD family reductase n=1 Tax=Acrocarpospora catenulata TaxID=2836182 RepID=UPI001BDA48E3|nr:EthD family reductase [Acrocarpospora catenulata]